MLCSYAPLDHRKLDTLQKAEADIGKTLVAFSCQDVQPAELSAEQLQRLQTLEKELGVVLVAL